MDTIGMRSLVLALDPGDTTGLVITTLHGDLQWLSQYKESELGDYLEHLAPGVFRQVVMENYITYKHKAMQQSGSKQTAARIIGMVTMWAQLNKIPVALQMASVLPIAERWSKMAPKGAHENTHWIDAYNHAVYWLVTNKLMEPRTHAQAVKITEKG